jgi:signal transduction histidine kinase/CheY-like chemotaxis protein
MLNHEPASHRVALFLSGILMILLFITLAYSPYPVPLPLYPISIFLFTIAFSLFRNLERVIQLERSARNAKEHAELRNKAKSDFLAFIAHELRNPLQAIMGITHLMKREETTELIENCCALMNNVLDDVIDMSRIELGQIKLESVPFRWSEFSQQIDRFGRVCCKAKNLSWEYKVVNMFCAEKELERFEITADPTRLKQILFNVINNGIKFTEKGSISLKVLITKGGKDKLDNGNLLIRFEVADEGIGFDEEYLKVIFQSYHQANLSISRMYGGSGLGLAIVKRLANQMHGEVYAQSTPQRGSTFSVEIPVFGKLGLIQVQEKPINLLQDESDLNSESISCLLVEDDELNRTIASAVLTHAGIKVTAACDGIEAVEICKSNERFDIILMDLLMPRQDGVATTKILRDLGFNLPIIALTAHVSDAERQKCLSAGMDRFMTKPIRPVELIDIIKEFRGKRTTL